MIDLSLLKPHRPQLAQAFAADWETPLADYAARLYRVPPLKLPQEFLDLLVQQVEAAHWGRELALEAAEQLPNLPVLQCSHHVTPSFGPTFTTIDLISLSGLPPHRLYLIAAASGVAFSNSAWSGALSYGYLDLERLMDPARPGFAKALAAAREREAHGEEDRRISLIPSKMRDQLVYGSGLPEDFAARLAELQPEVRRLLAKPQSDDNWTSWAGRSAAAVQQAVFAGRRYLMLDLNGLAASYLSALIRQRDPWILEVLTGHWQSPEMNFLAHYQGKKSNKVLACRYLDGELTNEKTAPEPLDLDQLATALETGTLAPGVWLCFLLLRFRLGLHCLGSFAQVDYLPRFAEELALAPYASELDLVGPEAPILTTGRYFEGGHPLWPLDRALEGKTLDPARFATLAMKEFWRPLALRLIEEA
ncbi:MAG: hypothetical protein RRB13_10050 [bacterium]|nr:hypothetical protein [bacterium]